MIYKKNNLILDHILVSDCDNVSFSLPVSAGLVVKKEYSATDIVNIANIYWDYETETCYIKTISDNLQTHIVTDSDYKDFIQLIDEAYYKISLVHNQ